MTAKAIGAGFSGLGAEVDLPDGKTGGAIFPPGEVAVYEAGGPCDRCQGPARTRRSSDLNSSYRTKARTRRQRHEGVTTIKTCPKWDKKMSYNGSRSGLSQSVRNILTSFPLFTWAFGVRAILCYEDEFSCYRYKEVTTAGRAQLLAYLPRSSSLGGIWG